MKLGKTEAQKKITRLRGWAARGARKSAMLLFDKKEI